MAKPTISVIIPNLNSPVIDRTIDSIKKQTYSDGDLEIIVVGKDIHNLIQSDEIVRFIETREVLNPAQARNLGVENSKGEELCFIDADCIADKNWLKHLLSHKDEAFGAVGGAVQFPSDNYWTLSDNIACFHLLLTDRKRGIFYGDVLGAGNFSIKRNTLLKSGCFDEKFSFSCEDYDLILRLKNAGHRIGFEPKAIVSHHPYRCTILSICKHASLYAKGFIALQKKYPSKRLNREYFSSNRYLLFLISPIKSFIFSIKVFYQHPIIAKYFYTIPGLFIFKLAWYYTVFREDKRS